MNNRFSDGFLFVCFYQDIWGVFSDTSRDAFPFLWTWKVVFLYMQAEISGTDKASNVRIDSTGAKAIGERVTITVII